MKLRQLICTCFVLCLSVYSWAQVELTILCDDEEGNPYSDVMIILESKSGKNTYEGTTNHLGITKMEVPEGMYSISLFTAYDVVVEEIKVMESKTLEYQLSRSSELEDVLIQSVRKGSEDHPSSDVVYKDDVQKLNNGRDMPYIFRELNNVVTTSDAGAGVGYTGMRIRGGDQTSINVSLNGVPLNDSESHNVFWVDLPDLAASVKDLSVNRGISSSAHGSGTFGASVHVNTNDWSQVPKTLLSLGVGSFGYKKGSVAFHSGEIQKGFYLNGRYSVLKSDGYVDRADADLSSLHLSMAYFFKNSSLRLSMLKGDERTYQSWYGISDEQLQSDRKFNPAGTERPNSPYQDQVDDYGQDHYQLQFKHQISEKTNASLTGFYTKGKGFYEEYKADESVSEYGIDSLVLDGQAINESDLVRRRWLDNDYFGAIFSTNTTLGNNLQMDNGLSLSRYIGKHFGDVIWLGNNAGIQNDYRYYDNIAVKNELSGYSKITYNKQSDLMATIDLQARYINYKYDGLKSDNTIGQLEDNLLFVNPKLFVTKYVGNSTQLFFKTGLAHREPNRDDYVDAAPNKQPKSERLWDTEIGMRHHFASGLDVDVNLYYMNYKDQLVNIGTINDVGAYVRTNIEKSHRLGAELNAAYLINKNWKLNASLALNDSKATDFSDFVDSYDADFNWAGQTENKYEERVLPFSPHTVAFFGIEYHAVETNKMSFTPTLKFKYIGQQYLDLSNVEQAKLDAYQTVDLGLLAKLNWGRRVFSISAEVINLLDEEYVSNGWSYKYYVGQDLNVQKGNFPQAGRHFLVNMTMSL